MAGDEYDNSQYVLLREQGIGAGSEDASTQPLDTHLENQIDQNLRWLSTEPNEVAWTPIVRRGDVRRFASVRPTMQLLIPYSIRRDLDTLEIVVNADCELAGSSGGQVRMWAQFLIKNNQGFLQPLEESGRQVWQGSQSIRTFSMDVADFAQREIAGYLALWMHSVQFTTTGTTGNGYRGWWQYAYTTDSGPTDITNLIDETTAVLAGFEDGAGDWYDPIQVANKTVQYGGDPDVGSPLPVTPIDEYQHLPNDAFRIELYDASYLRVKAVILREHFSELGQPSFEMRPRETVLGQHVSKHGILVDEQYERKCLASVNSTGQNVAGDDWSSGVQPRWRWKRLDDGAEQPSLAVLNCRPVSTDFLEVRALVMAAHLQFRCAAEEIKELDERSAKGTFTYDFIVGQPPPGNFSSPLSGSEVARETVEVEGQQLWATSYRYPSPLMRQIYWGWMSAEGSATISPSEWRRTLIEGQLYEEDLPLLTEVSAILDVSDLDREKPCKVAFELQQFAPLSTDINFQSVTDDTGKTDKVSNTVIVCVGASAFEVPAL